MSRVERIEPTESQRRPQEPRETQPNPRKANTTPGLAEGDERTVEEALRNQKPRE